jgi:hypothetical protein
VLPEHASVFHQGHHPAVCQGLRSQHDSAVGNQDTITFAHVFGDARLGHRYVSLVGRALALSADGDNTVGLQLHWLATGEEAGSDTRALDILQ